VNFPPGPIWRIYRFEILAVGVLVGAAAAVLLVAAIRLDEVRPSAECMAAWVQFSYDRATGACRAAIEVWYGRQDESLIDWVAKSVPLLAGAVLGSVLVSREVEHRTAQLGWSLRGSRVRWLRERLMVAGIVLAAILGILALAGEVLGAATWYADDIRDAFWAYGVRGLPVLGRGAAVFAMAVVAGAFLGRQAPALLVSSSLALALVLWLGDVFPYGAAIEWVPESTPRAMADYDVAFGWRDGEGRILTLQDVLAIAPTDDVGVASNWADDEFERMAAVLRGWQLTEVEGRETLVNGAIAAAALGGAFVVVGRRRPY